jgi:hypothetical protein
VSVGAPMGPAVVGALVGFPGIGVGSTVGTDVSVSVGVSVGAPVGPAVVGVLVGFPGIGVG